MLRHKTATHACRDTATHPCHKTATPSASLDTALKLCLVGLVLFQSQLVLFPSVAGHVCLLQCLMSFIYPRAMFFVVIYLFVYCALTWNGGENTGTCQKKK